ncbi:MAG TPA: hypothetical protein PLV92_19475, partial [Pirellulaceae bacterium]|nr:hypothetical protein [Pirellulaceae bacterium]
MPAPDSSGPFDSSRKLDRRELFRGTAAAALALGVGAATGEPRQAAGGQPAAGSDVKVSAADAQSGRRPNLIREINARPGSTDWQLTRVRLDKNLGFRSPAIEGYCSRQSVAAGETLDIFVSTDPPTPFTLEIFRTGYYGGRGATLMMKAGPFQGVKRETPQPGEKNLH